MRKKLIGILICTLFVANISSVLGISEDKTQSEKDSSSNFVNLLEDQLDQENSDWQGAAVGSYEAPMAQSFKPTLNILTRIELATEKSGNPQGNLIISIRDNLSDDDLTMLSIPAINISNQQIWTEFDFPDINVVPDHTYYIVWSHDLWYTDNLVSWGETSPPDHYPRGEEWWGGNNHWEPMSENFDFCFKTYGVMNNPPDTPTITGPTNGKIMVPTRYNFTTIDPNNDIVSYFIDWGDGTNTSWIGPYLSGAIIPISHSWAIKGTYTIKAKAKDNYGGESEWVQLIVTMPCTPPHFPLLEWLLERFPHAFPILRHLMGY